ncbi:MAG: outer membrane beta-barrel protein [Acidobacteriota bacterium]
MRRVIKSLIVISAMALVAATPKSASAEGYVSPFIGANFGAGQADGRANFGVDAGYMGAGIAGFEVDYGYAPNFFGSAGSFGDNNVQSIMANLILGIPVGGTRGAGFRPYATIGLGLIRTQLDGAVGFPKIANTDMGLNGGVGVMGFLSNHAGLRADLRYFQNLSDENSTSTVQFGGFHFWRASFGVVIR